MTPQEQAFLDALKQLPLSAQEFTVIHTKFTIYHEAVDKVNNEFNLISHNDFSRIYTRHFLDAIFPQFILPELFVSHETNPSKRALDVGCGAGFPGIPLAILNPAFQHLCLDSSKKKIAWIEELVQSLALQNVAVQSERAEELARQPEYREQFDLVYSRALAKPQTAMELVLPFLKVNGHALFWAGGSEWSEVSVLNKASAMLGGSEIREVSYRLPDETADRWIAVIAKSKSTPAQYPRRASAMKRKLA